MPNGYFPRHRKVINNSTTTFHLHEIKSRMIMGWIWFTCLYYWLKSNGYWLLLTATCLVNHHDYPYYIIKAMHGSSVKVKRKQWSSSQKSKAILYSLFNFTCAIFWECIEKNYCVKYKILRWEFWSWSINFTKLSWGVNLSLGT